MPPPRSRERQILIALAVAGLIGLAWLGWQALGGLGVALLGLLVLFVALRVELQRDSPVSAQSRPESYGSHFRTEAEQTHTDRAARRAEVASSVSTARLFVIAGALLTTAGFGLIALGYWNIGGSKLPAIFGAISIFSFFQGKPW